MGSVGPTYPQHEWAQPHGRVPWARDLLLEGFREWHRLSFCPLPMGSVFPQVKHVNPLLAGVGFLEIQDSCPTELDVVDYSEGAVRSRGKGFCSQALAKPAFQFNLNSYLFFSPSPSLFLH